MNLNKKNNFNIDQLTFECINECTNRRDLEKIVRILRSGDAGYFPELQKRSEDRLKEIAPNSIYLQSPQPLTDKCDIPANVWDELEADLKEWENDIKKQDPFFKELSKPVEKSLPAVRTSRLTQEKNDTPHVREAKTDKKIKSSDNDKWDKFDVDEELTKMDVEEERKVEEAKKMLLDQAKKEKDIINSKLNIENTIPTEDLSDESRSILAEKAREKGNEYFKAGDLVLALAFYNESMGYKPSVLASNNRAITYIKMGRYKAAILDCTNVLEQDPDNVKALYRRSTAYRTSADETDWRRAVTDLERVLLLEPHNKQAENDYRVLQRKLNASENPAKVRLKIEEDKPKESLPILYYGPSTSGFRCEPNTMTYLMLTGSRCSTDRVPCLCNGAAQRVNPLCRNCGERTINELKRKTLVKNKSLEPIFGATEIARICRERKTNFFIFPSKKRKEPVKVRPGLVAGVKRHLSDDESDSPKSKYCESAVKKVDLSGGEVQLRIGTLNNLTENANPSNVTSVNSQLGFSPPSVSPRPEVQTPGSIAIAVKEEGGKERILAGQAKERGDGCYKAGDYATALAYYSTSIKLHPDTPALLGRAGTHIKLGRFSEAVSDCSRVLDMDGNSSQALLRRATAYSAMPDNKYWKLGLEDLERVVNSRPGDKIVQGDVNALMETLLGCKRRSRFLSLRDSNSSKPRGKGNVRDVRERMRNVRNPAPVNEVIYTPVVQSTPNNELPGKGLPAEQQDLAGDAVTSTYPVEGKKRNRKKNKRKKKNGSAGDQIDAGLKVMKELADAVQALKLSKVGQPIFVKETSVTLNGVPSKSNYDSRDSETLPAISPGKGAIKSQTELVNSPIENCSNVRSARVGNSSIREAVQGDQGLPQGQIKPGQPICENGETLVTNYNKEHEGPCAGCNDKNNSPENCGGAEKISNAQLSFISSKEPGQVLKFPFAGNSPSKNSACDSVAAVGFSASILERETAQLTNGGKSLSKPMAAKIGSKGSVIEEDEVIEENRAPQSSVKVEQSKGVQGIDTSKSLIKEMLPSSLQFYARWESRRKEDTDFSKRIEILRSVPPSRLQSVIGEKLDAEMLSELVRCVEQLAGGEPTMAADYLKCLPTISRFAPIKLFLDSSDRQRTRQVIEALESSDLALTEDIKSALL